MGYRKLLTVLAFADMTSYRSRRIASFTAAVPLAAAKQMKRAMPELGGA